MLAAEPSPWLQAPLIALMLFGALSTYGLPTWIALRRRHPNLARLVALNWLFGWLILPWIAALFWALSGASHPRCPRCGDPMEQIRTDRLAFGVIRIQDFCPACGVMTERSELSTLEDME